VRLLPSIAAILLAAPALAQSVSVEISATEIRQIDDVTLTVTTTDAPEGASTKAPDLSADWTQISSGKSSQFSMTNGKTKRSESTRLVLRPKRAGTFRIPPATLSVGGRQIATSDTLSVTVTPFAAVPAADAGKFEGDSALVAELPKEPVYAGQAFVVEFAVYAADVTRVRAPQSNALLLPKTVRREDLLAGADPPKPARVEKNGRLYQRLTVLRELWTVTEPGTLTVPSMSIERNRALFKRSDERLQSAPAAVEVKPLPKRDAPFRVGRYEATARLLPLGDTVAHVELKVTGASVGGLFDPPLFDMGDAVRVVRLPNLGRHIPRAAIDGGVPSQVWVFVYELTARSGSEHTVPAIEIDYFDPVAERFGTAKTEGLKWSVTLPEPVDPPPAAAGPAPEPKITPVHQQTWFLIAGGTALLLLLVSLGRQVGRPVRFGWPLSALRVAVVGLLFAALTATPPPPPQPSPIAMAKAPEYQARNLVICLDASASMNAIDTEDSAQALAAAEKQDRVPRNRFETARLLAADLIADLWEGDRVAIVLFGSSAYQLLPLTTDHRGAMTALRHVVLDDGQGCKNGCTVPGDATTIGDALAMGHDLLRDARDVSGALVLVTDGDDTGSRVAAADVVAHNKGAGTTIPVHTVVLAEGAAVFIKAAPSPFGGTSAYRNMAGRFKPDLPAMEALSRSTGGMTVVTRGNRDVAQAATTLGRQFRNNRPVVEPPVRNIRKPDTAPTISPARPAVLAAAGLAFAELLLFLLAPAIGATAQPRGDKPEALS